MSNLSRKKQREAIFELLFETEFHTESDANSIYELSSDNREFADDEYIKKVYLGVREHIDEIDAMIAKHAKGWKTSRMSRVSRSVIRLCVYEMLYEDSIPASVSLNEAVELSKKYDDEKARPFVNGVLNSIKNEIESSAKEEAHE